jgi:hypothetical protein
VSGRIYYFDRASVLPGAQATLFELGLQMDGALVSLSVLDGNPLLRNRVDLRLGADALGELFLVSKTHGNIYNFVSLVAVPEPASWALLIAGFDLIGAIQRRRRAGPFSQTP